MILAGDPVFPTFLTQEATAEDWFPEWVVLGYAFTDTAVFGRQYDQQQWAHAFGVSLLPARTADDVDELGNLITWQTGHPPEAKTFRELVQAPLLFFTGVHLAGAKLTAKTFAAGLDRFPPAATTTPTRLHLSWGKHGIWKGVDLTGGDDATVIWWDPRRQGRRRGRARGHRPLPLRRRRHAVPPRPVAEGAHHAVRSEDVVSGARHAAAGGRAAQLPVAGGVTRAVPGAVLGSCSAPCSVRTQPSTLDVPADHTRRVADRDAEVGQRAGDHGSRTHRDVASDVGSRQHDGAVPQPRAAADAHRSGGRELLAERAGSVSS